MPINFSKYKNKPTFFPSIGNDKTTWFWKNNITTDGLLMSYDVILKNKLFKNNPKNIKKVLGFNGLVIIDSGAFGQSQETDPEVIYTTQQRLNPDIAILLDSITSSNADTKSQKQSIRTTIANAKATSKLNKNKIALMAVVQGTTPETMRYCAKELSKLKFGVVGIPLSNFSKHRKYKDAIEKYLEIKKHFPANTIFHGLGCGSRTLIAILSHLGVRFFDSSAFYKAATFNEAVDPESFCSINRPNSRKECKACLLKQRQPKTFQETVNYNLREVLKEVQRCRCAVEKKQTLEYLQEKRLSPQKWKKLSQLL